MANNLRCIFISGLLFFIALYLWLYFLNPESFEHSLQNARQQLNVMWTDVQAHKRAPCYWDLESEDLEHIISIEICPLRGQPRCKWSFTQHLIPPLPDTVVAHSVPPCLPDAVAVFHRALPLPSELVSPQSSTGLSNDNQRSLFYQLSFEMSQSILGAIPQRYEIPWKEDQEDQEDQENQEDHYQDQEQEDTTESVNDTRTNENTDPDKEENPSFKWKDTDEEDPEVTRASAPHLLPFHYLRVSVLFYRDKTFLSSMSHLAFSTRHTPRSDQTDPSKDDKWTPYSLFGLIPSDADSITLVVHTCHRADWVISQKGISSRRSSAAVYNAIKFVSLQIFATNRSHLVQDVSLTEPVLSQDELGWLVTWDSNCPFVRHTVFATDTPPKSSSKLSFSMGSQVKRLKFPVHTTKVGSNIYVHRARIVVPNPLTADHPPWKYRVQSGYKLSQWATLPSPWSAYVSGRHDEADDWYALTRPTLRLAVISDTQYGARVFRHHIAHVSKRHVDALLHIGDCVHDGRDSNEWRTYWTGPLEVNSVGSTKPVFVARGNHDGEVPIAYAYLANPGNGAWYAFTKGGARFIVLDSNLDPQDHESTTYPGQDQTQDLQTSWLEAELLRLETKMALFRVVILHVPPYIEYWDPVAWERGDKNWSKFIIERWVPLFERYKVDLVLSGHSHVYQRGNANNIVYVTLGGGGARIEDPITRVAEWDLFEITLFAHHYLILEIVPTLSGAIDAETTEARTYRLEGVIYNLENEAVDAFSLALGT